jgi:hypothetical protein
MDKIWLRFPKKDGYRFDNQLGYIVRSDLKRLESFEGISYVKYELHFVKVYRDFIGRGPQFSAR